MEENLWTNVAHRETRTPGLKYLFPNQNQEISEVLWNNFILMSFHDQTQLNQVHR